METEIMLREAESIQLNIGEIIKVLKGEPSMYTKYELEILCNAICNAAEMLHRETIGIKYEEGAEH